MKRIVIHGWPTQPSLVEFENLLASLEAMTKQIGGITLKVKKKHSTQVKDGAIIGRLPNVDTMVTKEEVTKELYNHGELRRTMTITLKGRDLKAYATIAGKRATCTGIVGLRKNLKAYATIAGKRATCTGIVGLRKNLSKAMWHPSTWRWRRNGMQRYCMR